MTPFDRVKLLCQKRGLSIVDLEEKLGFSRNSLYSWKKNNPSIEKLEKVADYFRVSTDFLLGREDMTTNKGLPTDLDLDEILDNTMSFDGQPMTDSDREAIRAYLIGRFSNK